MKNDIKTVLCKAATMYYEQVKKNEYFPSEKIVNECLKLFKIFHIDSKKYKVVENKYASAYGTSERLGRIAIEVEDKDNNVFHFSIELRSFKKGIYFGLAIKQNAVNDCICHINNFIDTLDNSEYLKVVGLTEDIIYTFKFLPTDFK